MGLRKLRYQDSGWSRWFSSHIGRVVQMLMVLRMWYIINCKVIRIRHNIYWPSNSDAEMDFRLLNNTLQDHFTLAGWELSRQEGVALLQNQFHNSYSRWFPGLLAQKQMTTVRFWDVKNWFRICTLQYIAQGRGGSLQIGGCGDEATGGSDPAMGRRIFSQVFVTIISW